MNINIILHTQRKLKVIFTVSANVNQLEEFYLFNMINFWACNCYVFNKPISNVNVEFLCNGDNFATTGCPEMI